MAHAENLETMHLPVCLLEAPRLNPGTTAPREECPAQAAKEYVTLTCQEPESAAFHYQEQQQHLRDADGRTGEDRCPAHRQASNVDHSANRAYPWRLPGHRFRHRL